MSGLSGVGSSSTGTGTTSSQTGTLGNVPPISFPGIASGIDYNAIIEKLTSLTLAQNQPLNAENNNLAAQNKELLKINGLIQNVQSAISNLGDSSLLINLLRPRATRRLPPRNKLADKRRSLV